MCEPISATTALSAAAFGVDAGSSILGALGQNKAAKANAHAATLAYRENVRDINLRETQEKTASTMSILEADRQARMAEGVAKVSAGEANLSGVSVDAVLNDVGRQAANTRETSDQNLDMTLSQLERDKVAGKSAMESRINSVPYANPFAVALRIGGSGLELGERVYDNNHPRK